MLVGSLLIVYLITVTDAIVADKQRTESRQFEPTQTYAHNSVLDTNSLVRLYWEYDSTHITFELHAQTTGWLGVGISPSGSMANADIVVGWVKDGTAYVTDRDGPTSGNSFPTLDTQQNVEMLDGVECDGWTVIKFKRQLAACEADKDLEITSDTLRVIYAYGSNDPSGDDITATDVHTTATRGSKSLILLAGIRSALSPPVGETQSTFDLLNTQFNLPAEDTYYNCKLLKLPTFTAKQHMVKIEPIIQTGNEVNVHHIVLYQCILDLTNSQLIGTDTQCYGPNMPTEFLFCFSTIHAWAIGGLEFNYPNNVGYPLGTDDAPKYVVMETHYDNPNKESNIIDSSGLRVTYTPNLRTYDAGVMQVGHTVNGYNDIIPPNAESFLDSGECTDQCLTKALELAGVEHITVFSVMLHAHLLGRSLTLKHVRNGIELPYLAEDRSYDFNYQETRNTTTETQILKGDTLQMVCSYNSKSLSQMTMSGLGTTQEMCLAFVFYYPKVSLVTCETEPSTTPLINYFNIETYNRLRPEEGLYANLEHTSVTSPSNLAGQSVAQVVNAITWDEAEVDKFAEAARLMTKNQICLTSSGTPDGISDTYSALTINQAYEPASLTCVAPSTKLTTSVSVGTCPAKIPSTTTTVASGVGNNWPKMNIILFVVLIGTTKCFC